jgi:hypothetical protein
MNNSFIDVISLVVDHSFIRSFIDVISFVVDHSFWGEFRLGKCYASVSSHLCRVYVGKKKTRYSQHYVGVPGLNL